MYNIISKAGKGRTGTAASSFLMRQNKCKNSMEALSFFGSTRFGDGDGVKIQSQRRYVQVNLYVNEPFDLNYI